jgi:beta-xylosidase
VNPVYAKYFADPFVWRARGEYFAIGTGPEEAGGSSRRTVFPLLRSRDLAHWNEAGSALVRPDVVEGDTFWAPEIACANGAYFLYYSVGTGDRGHQLRVAEAVAPEGPYHDRAALTEVEDVPFAIDPHPVQDDDGRWYLFHARDFPDTSDDRAGTALVVHELVTMTELAPRGATVLRAHFDWQLFAKNRSMYGRTFDWYTLEGPCVIKRGGRYFCLYSGGCWQNETYGVDYAVADAVLGPYDDRGGEDGPRVLRTIPKRMIGPGHCSVVRAPDDRTDMLVYHAWDASMRARTMRIDPLRFTPAGPRCEEGPT